MHPSSNLQTSSSGERHSSHQHYSMSQVNNEKPIIQREQEEQSQSWGQPQSSSSPSFYPTKIDSDRNFLHANRLASSSSSLFDRNSATLHDNSSAKDNLSYQQQSYTNQYRGTGHTVLPQTNAYRQQQQQSSSYSKLSNTTRQERPGIQHFHDVPFYHGFKFQTIPGFFCANEKTADFIEYLYTFNRTGSFLFRYFTI